MAAKKPKKRADKYNEKLRIKASFDDLMGVLFPKPNKAERNLSVEPTRVIRTIKK
jgi:hypothetical protein